MAWSRSVWSCMRAQATSTYLPPFCKVFAVTILCVWTIKPFKEMISLKGVTMGLHVYIYRHCFVVLPYVNVCTTHIVLQLVVLLLLLPYARVHSIAIYPSCYYFWLFIKLYLQKEGCRSAQYSFWFIVAHGKVIGVQFFGSHLVKLHSFVSTLTVVLNLPLQEL